MVAARTASFNPAVGFALSRESSSTMPESSAFAEVSADESTPATGGLGKIPSAVSSIQAVQRPFGASEKIFAPHLRHTLVTLIIARDSACVPFVLRKILSGLMRESQQSDNATRFRYRRESQRYEQFPRAITIDSFVEIDERPAKPHFRSSQVAPQYPPATARPVRPPAIG